MARKDLTALAALGTLGYMLSKKGDKKDEKSTSDAAQRRRDADRIASEEPQSMEDDSRMDPEEAANKRTERMLTNPNAKEYGEDGTSMTVSPSRKPAASSAVKTTAKPAPKTPAYVQSYTEDMMEADNPRSVKTEKTPAAASTAAAKPASSSRVPTSEQAAANRSAAMDKIKGVGSSIGDYFGSLDSTARYMKKKPAGEYKRGGSVKKMASGGMTSSASKRADGIATKGKTRGKMY